jgi:hypothetical protein
MQFFFQFYLSPHLTVPFCDGVGARMEKSLNGRFFIPLPPINQCHFVMKETKKKVEKDFVNALVLMIFLVVFVSVNG